MIDSSVAPPSTTAVTAYPYAPSWFDQFTDWLDQSGIPVPLFYGAMAALLVAVQLITQWNGTDGQVQVFPLAYIVSIAYVLALMHHLDKLAAQALARFRPLLTIDDAEYQGLLYRLTTLPSRPVLVAALLGMLNAVSLLIWIPAPAKVSELHFADTAPSLHFNHGMSLLIWAIIGILVYHTVHQLRVVQQIYDRCPGVDLHTLRPLYAFSNLSARTALGIALILYTWYLFAPSLFNIGIAGLIFFTAFSLLTFALPLQGARRLLVDEKERRLAENSARQRVALVELHRRVDAHDLADMGNLNQTMTGLEMERVALDRISVWPWKPETLRGVAAALLFPVIVWLTQWFLQRVLGP